MYVELSPAGQIGVGRVGDGGAVAVILLSWVMVMGGSWAGFMVEGAPLA